MRPGSVQHLLQWRKNNGGWWYWMKWMGFYRMDGMGASLGPKWGWLGQQSSDAAKIKREMR